MLTNKYIPQEVNLGYFMANCTNVINVDLTNLFDSTKGIVLSPDKPFRNTGLTENPYYQLWEQVSLTNMDFMEIPNMTTEPMDLSSYDTSNLSWISVGNIGTFYRN